MKAFLRWEETIFDIINAKKNKRAIGVGDCPVSVFRLVSGSAPASFSNYGIFALHLKVPFSFAWNISAPVRYPLCVNSNLQLI